MQNMQLHRLLQILHICPTFVRFFYPESLWVYLLIWKESIYWYETYIFCFLLFCLAYPCLLGGVFEHMECIWLQVFFGKLTITSKFYHTRSLLGRTRIALAPLNVHDAVVADEDVQGGRLCCLAGWADWEEVAKEQEQAEQAVKRLQWLSCWWFIERIQNGGAAICHGGYVLIGNSA